jgi:hypothetical protein
VLDGVHPLKAEDGWRWPDDALWSWDVHGVWGTAEKVGKFGWF